jgi:hypothetical protein
MRPLADFAYAQARMQARHGARLQEGDWKMLEGAQSLGLYLDRARATALKRFLGKISPALPPSQIERALREEAKLYAREVAGWIPACWRPAVAWIGVLPLLPLMGRAGHDAGSLADEAVQTAFTALAVRARSPDPAAVVPLWLDLWQETMPRGESAAPALRRLADIAGRTMRRAARSGASDALPTGRSGLERLLLRGFRSHGATPLAVVAHVGLVFLDLERLRGGLCRRALFGPGEGRLAA